MLSPNQEGEVISVSHQYVQRSHQENKSVRKEMLSEQFNHTLIQNSNELTILQNIVPIKTCDQVLGFSFINASKSMHAATKQV